MWRAGLRLVRYGSSTTGSKFLAMKKVSLATSGSNPNPKVPNISNFEELSPNDMFHVSQKYLEESNFTKSEEALKMMISKDPESIHGSMTLSSLLMVRGQYEEALKLLKRIIEMPSPLNPLDFCSVRLRAPISAAYCCALQGKFSEAIGYLEPIASMEEPKHPLAKDGYYLGIEMLRMFLSKTGRKDEAAKYEKIILAKDPENLCGLMSRGKLLMKRGQFEEALKCLERVIFKPCPDEDPQHLYNFRLVAPQMAAGCCFSQGKFLEAFEYLEPIASMKVPEHPLAKDGYYLGIEMLGKFSFAVGRKDDAAKFEKIIFDKDPAAYARRIPHLASGYKEFVESLKYV